MRILRKVFFLIGKIVTDAVIRIWQARQLTEMELAERMKEHPHPNYVPPEHVTYPNAKLPDIPKASFDALVHSATAPPPPPIESISLYTTSRKLRTMGVVGIPSITTSDEGGGTTQYGCAPSTARD